MTMGGLVLKNYLDRPPPPTSSISFASLSYPQILPFSFGDPERVRRAAGIEVEKEDNVSSSS
jgi:hypothetical protein